MRVRVMMRVLLGLLGIVLGSMLDASAAAQSDEGGARVRVWAGPVGRYVLSDNDPFTNPTFGTTELKVDGSAFGFGGDVEYKFGRWVGVDAALGYTRFNVDFATSTAPNLEGKDKLGVVPLLFALNFHVINTRTVDFWVGPQIGYVMFTNNLSYLVPGVGTFDYEPKNTFSPEGFAFGTDISISKSAAFNFAFRWQNADADDDGNLTIDPTFVTFGFTKKF